MAQCHKTNNEVASSCKLNSIVDCKLSDITVLSSMI